jgi:hypothetical protein
MGHAYESSQIEEKNLVIQPEKFRIRLRFHVTSMLGLEIRPNIAHPPLYKGIPAHYVRLLGLFEMASCAAMF